MQVHDLVPVTRFHAPAGVGLPVDTALEAIHQPLYSTCYINNGITWPNETLLFNYGLGDPVSGSANVAIGSTAATDHQTNLELGGQLPKPKMFLCQAFRLFISPLIPAGNDHILSSFDATAANPAVSSWAHLFYATWFQFKIGSKLYAKGPSWMFPANSGVGGKVAISTDDVVANPALAGRVVDLHGAGKAWKMDRYPIMIYSQQNFGASIRATQATPPTTDTELTILCVADGITAREVQ